MKKFKPTSSIVAVDGGGTAEKSPPGYGTLLDQISTSFVAGQTRAIRAVNASATETYWEIGRHIVEFEQKGKIRADYGSKLLDRLSCDLRLRHGKGFSRSNIVYMRMLYLAYEKRQTLSDELSWSHYIELLQIDDPLERDFYLHQSAAEKWSLRELRRQIKSALFLRLAASKDKRAILRLAQKGQEIGKPADIIKSPLIFEFLNIPQNTRLTERGLETRLCDNLSSFLLELGRGFAFVGRQYRISIGNEHFHVDLVFYHRILRCFVLFDLKLGKVDHADIGQMNLYLGYFAKEENIEGDNPPVGIILSRQDDKLLVEYATYKMDSRLFVQRYQLYLPNQDELRREIERTLAETTESTRKRK